MNFQDYTIQRFKLGIDLLRREYQVSENKDGTLKIWSVITGKVLFQNLDPLTVLVNGVPMSSLDQLQKIIYNSSCECSGETDDSENKIFDLTFDNTFE